MDRFDQLLKWTIEKPADSAAANLGQFFSYFWSIQDGATALEQ